MKIKIYSYIHIHQRGFKKGLSFSFNSSLYCNFLNKSSKQLQKDSRSIPKLILVLVFILPKPSPSKIVAPFKLPLLKWNWETDTCKIPWITCLSSPSTEFHISSKASWASYHSWLLKRFKAVKRESWKLLCFLYS